MLFSNNKLKLSEKAPPRTTSLKSIVRNAFITDINEIIELAYLHRELGSMPSIRKEDAPIDFTNLRKVLMTLIMNRGLVLVAENNKGLTGFMFGRVLESIWTKGVFYLEQTGFYAKNKRAGHDLLIKYLSDAQALKDKGIIDVYLMTEMVGVSVDYSRFGMKLIERNWVNI
jgi:hypothetical protein